LNNALYVAGGLHRNFLVDPCLGKEGRHLEDLTLC